MRNIAVLILIISLMPWTRLVPATHQISMVGLTFVPDTLTVLEGDTVMWKNNGAMSHTTTSGVNGVPDGIWDSGLMAPGDSFKFVFTTTNNYPYYCTPHWQLGMVGLIVVRANAINEGRGQTRSPVVLMASPNPFTGRVHFTMARMPADGPVRIVDPSGCQIRTLALASKNRPLSLEWDGTDETGTPVAAGVYYAISGRERPVILGMIVKAE